METVLIAQFRPAKEFSHDRVVNEDRTTKDGAQHFTLSHAALMSYCRWSVRNTRIRAAQKLRR